MPSRYCLNRRSGQLTTEGLVRIVSVNDGLVLTLQNHDRDTLSTVCRAGRLS